MSIRHHVLSLLHSHTTRKIKFTYRGLNNVPISVGNDTFNGVAQKIMDNSIRLDGPHDIQAGSDACYYSNNFTDAAGHAFSGRFCLTTHTGSRIWDAVFIHEAVHASLDLTGSTLTLADN